MDYDTLYEYFEGWIVYAKYASTFKLRRKIGKKIEMNFPNEISTKEINRFSKHKSTVLPKPQSRP